MFSHGYFEAAPAAQFSKRFYFFFFYILNEANDLLAFRPQKKKKKKFSYIYIKKKNVQIFKIPSYNRYITVFSTVL